VHELRLVALRRVGLVPEQQAREAEQAAHRRAQLVTHIGEDQVLGGVRLLRDLLRRAHLFERAAIGLGPLRQTAQGEGLEPGDRR
jgi:hypothetical protein